MSSLEEFGPIIQELMDRNSVPWAKAQHDALLQLPPASQAKVARLLLWGPQGEEQERFLQAFVELSAMELVQAVFETLGNREEPLSIEEVKELLTKEWDSL
jgi:hypothetical protein